MPSSNDLKGLLIDCEFCSGCHACEVACKKEHDMAQGEYGITVKQDGPRKMADGRWDYNFIPVPTEACDLCAERVARGKKPRCVHHCQALIIEYGTVADLAQKVTKPEMVLFVPKGQ